MVTLLGLGSVSVCSLQRDKRRSHVRAAPPPYVLFVITRPGVKFSCSHDTNTTPSRVCSCSFWMIIKLL